MISLLAREFIINNGGSRVEVFEADSKLKRAKALYREMNRIEKEQDNDIRGNRGYSANFDMFTKIYNTLNEKERIKLDAWKLENSFS